MPISWVWHQQNLQTEFNNSIFIIEQLKLTIMALLNSISKSSLGLKGKTPNSFDPESKLDPLTLAGSQLDLDGKTPKKYLDNPPQ
jgi:hypothetical protein